MLLILSGVEGLSAAPYRTPLTLAKGVEAVKSKSVSTYPKPVDKYLYIKRSYINCILYSISVVKCVERSSSSTGSPQRNRIKDPVHLSSRACREILFGCHPGFDPGSSSMCISDRNLSCRGRGAHLEVTPHTPTTPSPDPRICVIAFSLGNLQRALRARWAPSRSDRCHK